MDIVERLDQEAHCRRGTMTGDLHRDAKAEIERLRMALRFYGNECDANESGECGYEGNLCCRVAREALGRTPEYYALEESNEGLGGTSTPWRMSCASRRPT